MPKRKSKPPKRQPEFRLRLTPADRKWHAAVTKHALRRYKAMGPFLRQAITVLYAIETRPTVSSGPILPPPPAFPFLSTGGELAYRVEGNAAVTGAMNCADPAADSLTHPEE